MRKTLVGLTVVAAFMLALVSPARADTVTYTLSVPNGTLSPYPGPYATVTVDRTSTTTATITFNLNGALTNGNYEYLLGGAQAADVQVNATSFSVGTPTGTQPTSVTSGVTFSLGTFTVNTGAKNSVDGFGKFNVQIDVSDGFTSSATSISFTLKNNSGTWASASDVLANNASGFPVAGHIFVYDTSVTTSTGKYNPATGFASTPEPTSLLLLGTGLLGLGALRRRRKKAEKSE